MNQAGVCNYNFGSIFNVTFEISVKLPTLFSCRSLWKLWSIYVNDSARFKRALRWLGSYIALTTCTDYIITSTQLCADWTIWLPCYKICCIFLIIWKRKGWQKGTYATQSYVMQNWKKIKTQKNIASNNKNFAA